MCGFPILLHLLVCIALRINKPSITKVSYLLHFFNKNRALVLFLGFQYFNYKNINESITNSVVSLFIDSGAGLVLSMDSSEQRKQVYICVHVCMVHDEQTNRLHNYWCLLTNR